MYLIYIDESGTTNFTDHRDYILAALIIHESTWRKFDRKISQIKLDYFPNKDPMEIELHASKLAKYTDEATSQLEITTRHSIFRRMSNIVKKNKCRLLCSIIDKEKIEDHKKSPEWVQLWAWRILLERIEKFLIKKNDDTMTNFGILCVDSNSQNIVSEIKSIVQEFRKEGSMYLDSKYLIEDPFFVDSSMRNLTQLADFVAWFSKQWFNRYKGRTSTHDTFNIELFNNIIDRFDKTKNNEVFGAGIKIHPG